MIVEDLFTATKQWSQQIHFVHSSLFLYLTSIIPKKISFMYRIYSKYDVNEKATQ